VANSAWVVNSAYKANSACVVDSGYVVSSGCGANFVHMVNFAYMVNSVYVVNSAWVADVTLEWVASGNTEKGCKQPPYTEQEGGTVVPGKFEEEWDPNLFSNPSDCTGPAVGARLGKPGYPGVGIPLQDFFRNPDSSLVHLRTVRLLVGSTVSETSSHTADTSETWRIGRQRQ